VSTDNQKLVFEPPQLIVPNDWQVLPFKKAMRIVSDQGKRIKKRDYQDCGTLPVIDQGQEYVGGYTDNQALAFDDELPVIIFGDHTRATKYVDKTFVVGAEGVKILKPSDGFEPKFLYYFLCSLNIPSRGYSRHFQFLRRFTFPFAPIDQQKAIVAEIEKQFFRLDEAVTSLKRAKANLKRYKAAVLKAAVEGKLTEEWRKQHPDVEPASELLKRILAERRRKWEEAELAKMLAKGKEPKDDKWKDKYKEPEVMGSLTLQLPSNWTTATVKQLAEIVQYGSSSKTSEDASGVPVLRMGNILNGELILDKLKYLSGNHDEFPKLFLDTNDLLFNRTNSPELVGKSAVYKATPDLCSFASYLIRVKLNEHVDPSFYSYFLNSYYGRQWIKTVVSQQVGQANVNGTKLQALTVPLPPSQEQNLIVQDVEQLLSNIRSSESEAELSLEKTESLRQVILKKAFTGQLLKRWREE